MQNNENTELVDGILDIDQSDLLNTKPAKPILWPSYAVGAAIAFAILFGVTLYLLSQAHG